MRNLYIILSLLFTVPVVAQKLNKADRAVLEHLKGHISYLAHDSLEGRRTGTAGEAIAARYLSGQFGALGLQPKGTQQFLQPFEVYEGRQVLAPTHLTVAGKLLELNREFFPLPYSANASVEALPSMALHEEGMPWFVDLKEIVEGANPHFDLDAAIQKKAQEVATKGGTTLFVYNTAAGAEELKFKPSDRSDAVKIPVVYLTKEAIKKYFNDPSATLDIDLRTEIGPKTRTGTNVAGYINNNATSTLIFGAHFDHLGYGEDGGSLNSTSGRLVHNGADDNASGTAALLELARMLKASGPKQFNYLFLAFSGEELGLYGSKFFTENPTIDLAQVSAMVNMDMVGRLNPASPTLTIGGYGTSPVWGQVLNTSGKRGVYKGNMQLRFDSSGAGPSDHTSFYRKNIPVLFYFTGTHADYHKPSDDAEKINYEGTLHIVKHIYSVVQQLEKAGGKIAFTPTREVQMNAASSFRVTLGIMPDYTYSGKGVRVEGTSENRPAQKAGIKAGDVIVQMGDLDVSSMEKYMEALGRFSKGDKVTVTYMRGAQKLSGVAEL
jgi:hypothetical protein